MYRFIGGPISLKTKGFFLFKEVTKVTKARMNMVLRGGGGKGRFQRDLTPSANWGRVAEKRLSCRPLLCAPPPWGRARNTGNGKSNGRSIEARMMRPLLLFVLFVRFISTRLSFDYGTVFFLLNIQARV